MCTIVLPIAFLLTKQLSKAALGNFKGNSQDKGRAEFPKKSQRLEFNEGLSKDTSFSQTSSRWTVLVPSIKLFLVSLTPLNKLFNHVDLL
jgi:hypothetical protein